MSWVMKLQWYMKPLEFTPDRTTITLERDGGSGWEVVTSWSEYQILHPYTYNITDNSGKYRVVVVTAYHGRVKQHISQLIGLPAEETRPSRRLYLPAQIANLIPGSLATSTMLVERVTFTIVNVTRQEDIYATPYGNVVEQEMLRLQLSYILREPLDALMFMSSPISINNSSIIRSSSITIGAV